MHTMSRIRSLGQEQSAEQVLDVSAIFKAHHAFVWRILRHLGVGAADQDDALQEVFVVVHRRLGDYSEQAKIRAWLYAICTRVVRDHRRRLSRRREDPRELPDLSHQPSQASAVADQQALWLAQHDRGAPSEGKQGGWLGRLLRPFGR